MRIKTSKPKDNQKIHGLYYLKIFIFIVLFFSVLSLGYKLIRFIESSKLSQGNFNLLFISKDVYLLNLDKDQKQISLLKVKEADRNLKSFERSRLSKSVVLGLPLDHQFFYNSSAVPDKNFFTLSRLIEMLTSSQNKFDNLSKSDLVKIYFIEKAVPDKNIRIIELTQKELSDSNNYGRVDKILYENFRDVQTINEKSSVEIINATGQNGLGSKFARVLKNVGYNVIGVNSDEEAQKSKILYRSKNKESLERLITLLNFQTDFSDTTDVSDITITLGRDLTR